MTPVEREQVVELLRCAADDFTEGGGINGMWSILTSGLTVDVSPDAEIAAWNALASLWGPLAGATIGQLFDVDAYKTALLEAAQRVEEGSWP